MRTQLIIATAAASLLFAAPALAAGETWRVGNNSYHIYLDDLDLRTQAGRAQALARVEKAADRLCANAGTRSEGQACQGEIVQAVDGRAGGILRTAMAERARQSSLAMARSR
jgi:UrcA family protein